MTAQNIYIDTLALFLGSTIWSLALLFLFTRGGRYLLRAALGSESREDDSEFYVHIALIVATGIVLAEF